MKVHVKIFPAAGLCDKTQKMDVTLEEGDMGELETRLQERLGVNSGKIRDLMLLHNGCASDRRNDVIFRDGDQLWLMPVLSGG